MHGASLGDLTALGYLVGWILFNYYYYLCVGSCKELEQFGIGSLYIGQCALVIVYWSLYIG